MSDGKDPAKTPEHPQAQLQSALKELSSGMERLVEDTIDSLAGRGVNASDLAPLMKLRRAIRALEDVAGVESTAGPAASPAAPDQLHREHDARCGEVEASESLLARASAIIDILVQGGQPPEHAAQLVTRQLLSVGIHLPESGGDARAWKRLFTWRNILIHHKRSGPAWDAYCAFKEELAGIPPDQRLRRAVGERLWDQRQQQYTDQDSA